MKFTTVIGEHVSQAFSKNDKKKHSVFFWKRRVTRLSSAIQQMFPNRGIPSNTEMLQGGAHADHGPPYKKSCAQTASTTLFDVLPRSMLDRLCSSAMPCNVSRPRTPPESPQYVEALREHAAVHVLCAMSACSASPPETGGKVCGDSGGDSSYDSRCNSGGDSAGDSSSDSGGYASAVKLFDTGRTPAHSNMENESHDNFWRMDNITTLPTIDDLVCAVNQNHAVSVLPPPAALPVKVPAAGLFYCDVLMGIPHAKAKSCRSTCSTLFEESHAESHKKLSSVQRDTMSYAEVMYSHTTQK